MSASDILRTHILLGHAESGTLMRIFKLAGRKVDSTEVEKILDACKCERMGSYPENPVISKYSPGVPGGTIFTDVFYPESASTPALLIVCAFSKFVCARFSNSLKPMALISILLNNWTCLFGMPESIICDMGNSFYGK